MSTMNGLLNQVAELAKYEALQSFVDAKSKFEAALLDATRERDDALRQAAAAKTQLDTVLAAVSEAAAPLAKALAALREVGA